MLKNTVALAIRLLYCPSIDASCCVCFDVDHGANMDAEAYAACLRFELKKKGLTLAEIANKVGVSTSLVSKTLKRQRKNPDVQKFVATSLGVPAEQLWQLEFRDALVSTDFRREEDSQRKET